MAAKIEVRRQRAASFILCVAGGAGHHTPLLPCPPTVLSAVGRTDLRLLLAMPCGSSDRNRTKERQASDGPDLRLPGGTIPRCSAV